MSDFEMVMLFNETFDFLIASFTTFLSIVFAFLIASTLLATRLSRKLAGIAVALFSGAALFFVVLCYNVAANLGNIAEVIKSSVADGTADLGWIEFVATDAPVGLGLRLLAGLMLLAYAASIFFFLAQRHTTLPSDNE
jgi:hypothetical protein